eukprot:61269-Rhodomonas_salina.1
MDSVTEFVATLLGRDIFFLVQIVEPKGHSLRTVGLASANSTSSFRPFAPPPNKHHPPGAVTARGQIV